MKDNKVYEVAASFINGNISWVRDNIRTKKDAFQVLDCLREIGNEKATESFIKLMINQ